MRLSEVLPDWPEKKLKRTGDDLTFNRAFNTALTSCDHDIDREALAKVLKEFTLLHAPEARTDYFISTMPSWLKPIEGSR